MIVLDLEQGSDLWLAARLEHFTASEAPAMMGESKYMSRKELLALKKGKKPEAVNDFKQAIFDKGHAAEDAARPHMEIELFADLRRVTGSFKWGDLNLLASFDGLSDDGAIWEHKLWNETLAENVRNDVLEPTYYWQLEHQMLVAGQLSAHFTTSDGTTDKCERMVYESDPERRKQLIAGWKQFAKDLEEFEIEAKRELVEARDPDALPAVSWKVEGTVVISNIQECLPLIRERAEQEMATILETDQDFADKQKLNVATKAARAKLKQVVTDVQGEFVSYSEFAETAREIDSVLQKMQSHGEKQVKQDKEKKRQHILSGAAGQLADCLVDADQKISPVPVRGMFAGADFDAVMKGKRSIEGWQNAVDDELARVKIEIDQVVNRVSANLVVLRELAEDYKFLFNDTAQIINQPIEPFTAIVKQRIAEHKEAEEKRLEAEREAIRVEEQRKATAKAEREAAEKAEKERVDAIAAAKLAEPEPKKQEKPTEQKPAEVVDTKQKAEPKQILEEPTLEFELAKFCAYYKLPPAAILQLKTIVESYARPIDERKIA